MPSTLLFFSAANILHILKFWCSSSYPVEHSRHQEDDRDHRRHHSSRSEHSSSRTDAEESDRKRRERDWEAETPRTSSYRSTTASRYIETPRNLRPTDTPGFTPSRSTPWERDNEAGEKKRFRYEYTPLQTPSYMQNPWMKGSFGGGRGKQTAPTPAKESQTPSQTPFVPVDEKEMEAEAERLDRNWYMMDNGYDEGNNPFIGESFVPVLSRIISNTLQLWMLKIVSST